MDALRYDLKYAIRALRHRPWFSVLAVLTLAEIRSCFVKEKAFS